MMTAMIWMMYSLYVPASKDIPLRQQLSEVAAACWAAYQQLEAIISFTSPKGDSGFSGKISHSQPPWNAAVAFSIMGLHQLARDTEAKFRLISSLPSRDRGGSSKNTQLSLEALVKLAEPASDAAVTDSMRDFDRWLRHARITLGELEFPQRLPRLPGQAEPKCPFCEFRTLRMFPLRGFIVCITPDCKDEQGRKAKAVMEYSSFTCQWELVWQDNIVGVPVEEAA
jgi:hypothetical protein